ncbi:MAG: hypothetical protein Tp172SUR151031_9 [Prokaryotic dsDNA virus sp.]|nr:MAG: hypothetical protein Tp172SUR151031_9 [Prokaryotic dsDNA virus sp.]|tara:strand:+ start:3666 stop:4061 length:396 start_codon:yes stop_codon:yes gene_type:complete
MNALSNISDYTNRLLEIEERFEECFDVIERLPTPIRKQKMNAWPLFKTDPGLAYGYNVYTISRPKPSPEQIDRADQSLYWLIHCSIEQRRLIWARAKKYSWRKIAAVAGCSKDTAKYRWQEAIMTIAEKIN